MFEDYFYRGGIVRDRKEIVEMCKMDAQASIDELGALAFVLESAGAIREAEKLYAIIAQLEKWQGFGGNNGGQ